MATPVWQVTDLPVVFHHTTPEQAEIIASSGVFLVGQGNLLGPTGVYAGAHDPEAVSLQWVRRNYFFGLWPLEALGGVVVFAADDPQLSFEELAPDMWVARAPVGELHVADVVLGWGHHDGAWWWSAGLYAAP